MLNPTEHGRHDSPNGGQREQASVVMDATDNRSVRKTAGHGVKKIKVYSSLLCKSKCGVSLVTLGMLLLKIYVLHISSSMIPNTVLIGLDVGCVCIGSWRTCQSQCWTEHTSTCGYRDREIF